MVNNRVLDANKLDNPLFLLSQGEDKEGALTLSLNDGEEITIRHFRTKEVSGLQWKWIMDLMQKNMKCLYEKSEDGWNARNKKKEMLHKRSRFLIAYSSGTNNPVAFTHFQFDMDYGREALYCYEIQLETESRGNGLGKQIMKTLEDIATSTKVELVVLTVFKHNPSAIAFFNKIGYEIDETCPGEEEGKDYLILSKPTL